MEASKSTTAATSPSSTDLQLLLPPPELDSQLSSLIYGLSQQVQAAMENMLKMIKGEKNLKCIFTFLSCFADLYLPLSIISSLIILHSEVDQNSAEVMEEIEKCKDSALEKKKLLEEEKEHFEKAAYTVLDMLNNSDSR
ncbi:hypothetical protein CK203_005369 [Vitis vinifera]|uniref:Uncharacterized protein n=1 Tax=Vitis vinifera TaxID=29760 RepID=A0A438KEF7_VITVI|nr:hypothetical protein CK203_005369 [Vitis vinifera]